MEIYDYNPGWHDCLSNRFVLKHGANNMELYVRRVEIDRKTKRLIVYYACLEQMGGFRETFESEVGQEKSLELSVLTPTGVIGRKDIFYGLVLVSKKDQTVTYRYESTTVE